jgi:hypothetical protein
VTSAKSRWTLGALVAGASIVIVSWVFNPTPHSGGDNSGYVALAHGLLTEGAYRDVFDPEGLAHTKYPPVFPALLALLMAVGARTWGALKLSAAVPTVVAAVLTYVWAERRLGATRALGVALLFSVSAAVVYYSQWILSDPLFVALTTGGLWALDRADAHETGIGRAWFATGVLFAALAFFTRSAGLPLILALLGWTALRRAWTHLAVAGTALAVPMAGWWLRGRGEGVAQYGTEFWMVDPYQPELGTIGPLGLLPRMVENLGGYVLRHGPGGVVGADTPALGLLGVLLAAAAVGGWYLSARSRLGVPELFFPLYVGLILVWPAVWGGDRFALPLYPLVFLYGAVALQAVGERMPAVAGRAVPAAALLLLLLPAGGNWLDSGRSVRDCSVLSQRAGPWACYGPRVGFFVSAAAWTADGLPAGSAVMTRKPRHFYVLSGHPSRAFPFVEDPDAHLALADQLGARYVLLDQWDGLAARYVGGAVRGRPEAFCYLRGFGAPVEGGAQLLGILPPEERAAPPEPSADVGIVACPESYYGRDVDVPEAYSSSSTIPLLADLDS